VFDADGADIRLRDGGTEFAVLINDSSNLNIQSVIQDKDIKFTGNDGGSGITALTLDMSAAGAATFNSTVTIGNVTIDGDKISRTGGAGFTIDVAGDISLDADGGDVILKDNDVEFGRLINDSTDFNIQCATQDKDIKFSGNDGGSGVNALILDMSAAGQAIFNQRGRFNGATEEGILTIAANTTAMDTNSNHHITLQNTSQTTSAKGLINYKTAADSGSGFIPVAFGGRTVDPANATRTGAFCIYVADTDNVDVDTDERLRVHHDGSVTIGKSSADNSTAGTSFFGVDGMSVARSGGTALVLNRLTNDGVLVSFRQANGDEGNISVSGSTISYNGFSGLHESSGIATDTPIGTVVSTIDELDVYFAKQGEGDLEEDNPKAGQTRADHAKVKVSDTEGDKAVYGVVGSFNAQGKVNVASVGIGSVRVTGACEKGDLLESNGDGTAKVQSDDIIRSKTIVTLPIVLLLIISSDCTLAVPSPLLSSKSPFSHAPVTRTEPIPTDATFTLPCALKLPTTP
jgi:hypothetical protein